MHGERMHGDASDLSRLREEHDRVRAILNAVAAGYLVSKDRVILEGDPYSLIESMTTAPRP